MTQQPTTQPIDLDAIEARAQAASKGPWRQSEDYADILGPDGDQLASYFKPADGEFIAHAPQDLAALVAEIHRLRKELAHADRIRENADFHLGQEMARRQLAEKETAHLRAQVAETRTKALCTEADLIVAHCPDHGSKDGVWMDCHCAVADDIRHRAARPAPTA